MEIFQIACHGGDLPNWMSYFHFAPFPHGSLVRLANFLIGLLKAISFRTVLFCDTYPTMSSPCFIRCRKRDRNRYRSVDVLSDLQYSDHSQAKEAHPKKRIGSIVPVLLKSVTMISVIGAEVLELVSRAHYHHCQELGLSNRCHTSSLPQTQMLPVGVIGIDLVDGDRCRIVRPYCCDVPTFLCHQQTAKPFCRRKYVVASGT